MEYLKAILLGVIQGATEFLPVSSSGHLSVAQHILGFDSNVGVLFDLMLHIGTLFAVFIAFRGLIGRLIIEFFNLVRDVFTGKFKWKEMSGDRRLIITLFVGLLPLLLFFLPIPSTDMNLKDLFTSFYADSTILIEGICFLCTAVFLMISHRLLMREADKVSTLKTVPTIKDSVFIGIFQGIATLPGISRSGSTLSAGIFRGITKQAAMEYSFVLGIPAILGASLLEIGDAVQEGLVISVGPMVIGMIVSALVGIAAISLLKFILKNNRLNWFAYYCFALGLFTTVIALVEQVLGYNIFNGIIL